MKIVCAEHQSDLVSIEQDDGSWTYGCTYEWAGYANGICPVNIQVKG